MGQVYPGIHEIIALKARDEFGLKALVETGTYLGKTSYWAKDRFEKVITIEISPGLYREAEDRIDNARNVLMVLGDSRDWLAPICRGRNNEPTLFWLDSHWTGEMEFIDPKGCPVLDEIKIINESFFGNHVVMVDDYEAIKRLNWADSDDIIRALEDRTNQNRQVRIVDDIYFACSRIPKDFDKWRK